MGTVMKYRGHFGSTECSAADAVYHGKLMHISDLVSYESEDAEGMKAAFEEAVDDYFVLCEAAGIEPNTPFKGSFSVKPGRELHQRAATFAKRQGVNLDAVVRDALRSYLDKKEHVA